VGLRVVAVSTPGALDVDIVSNAIAADQGAELPRFARTLAARGDTARTAFQSFIQQHLQS
jgi:hypothetical protein